MNKTDNYVSQLEKENCKLKAQLKERFEQDKYRDNLELLVKERTEELTAANEELAAINEELVAANDEILKTNDELKITNEMLNVEMIARFETMKKLEDSEIIIHNFIEQSFEGIMILDNEGRIVEWNNLIVTMTGISREEAIGEYDWNLLKRCISKELISPEVFEEMENLRKKYFSGGSEQEPISEEITFTGPNGEKIFLISYTFPIKLAETCMFGRVFHDITKQKNAEQNLIVEKERLETLGNNLPCSTLYRLVYEQDNKKYYMEYVNANWETITGLSNESVYKDIKPFFDAIHPDDVHFLRNATVASLNNLSNFNIDVRFNKNGEFSWLNIASYPYRQENKVIWDGIMRDVTARKEVESELTEYRKNLEALVLERTEALTTANEELAASNEELAATNNELNRYQTQLEQMVEKRTNELFMIQENLLAMSRRQSALINVLQIMRTEKNLSKAINMSLAETGKYTGVSRVYLIEKNREETMINCTYEWCNEGIEPAIHITQEIPMELFKSLSEKIEAGEIIYTSDVNTFDKEVAELFKSQNVKSTISVPLTINGVHYGLIGFDDCVHNREWSNDDMNLIKSIAQIISSATQNHHAETAARLSQQTMRRVLDNIDVSIAVFDIETSVVIFVNDNVKKIYGDVEGKICWQTMHKGMKGVCSFCKRSKIMDSNNQPAGVYSWEYFNEFDNKWYECRDQAIEWVDGRLVHIQHEFDVNDRKKAQEDLAKHLEQLELLVHERTNELLVINEELTTSNEEIAATNEELHKYQNNLKEMVEEKTKELHLSMERLETISNNIPKGTLYRFELDMKTKHMKFTYLGANWEKIMGIPVKQAMSDFKLVLEIIHSDDASILLKQIEESARTMTTLNKVIRVKINGLTHWIQIASQPHRSNFRKVLWDGIIIDVTTEQENECELKEYREKLEMLVKKRTEELSVANEELKKYQTQLEEMVEKRTGELRISKDSLLSLSRRQNAIITVLQIMRTEKDLSKAINLSLAETGKYINVSRVNIFQKDDKDGFLNCTYSWCNAGIEPVINILQNIPKSLSQIWFDTFEAGNIFCTYDINTLDPATSKFIENQDVKSTIAIPLTVKGKHSGIIVFDECTYKREWEKEDVNLIKSLAQIISSAISRYQAEENLLSLSRRQNVLINILQIMQSPDNTYNSIDKALEEIGKYAEVSRVFIVEKNSDRTHTNLTHEWCNVGISSAKDANHNLPVLYSQPWFDFFKESKVKCFSDLSEFDPRTREQLEGNNVKSIAGLPLTNYGEHTGFIGFTDCINHRHWNIDDIELLKSISQIISSATQRYHAEENLIIAKIKAEESDKLKTAFLANLSHEIRTPLNAIVGFSYFIGSDDLPLNEKQSYIETINSNSNQLLKILDDIVDVSKLEAGQLEIYPSAVNINELMNHLKTTFDKQLLESKKDKKIELTLDNSGFLNRCVIKIDKTRLQQVITNLLDNAIKFTDKGFIMFGYRLNETDDMLEFSVHDSGIGMTQDQVDIIFERFRQADAKSTRQYGGIGIGLSISYSLVKLMEGDMWVNSTIEEGTSFYFTIPHNH